MGDDATGKYKMVKYYTKNNTPNFLELLKISERLPQIAEKIGVGELGKIIMVELTKFVNCYTVVRPMNAVQISECAMALIISSEEDWLSLQDIIIFLEGAKQGKYGRVLDHIDQHVIFEMLEQYRQERHRQYINIKAEKESQHKVIGDSERSNQVDELSEHFARLGNRMSDLKKQVDNLKQENYSLKIDKL